MHINCDRPGCGHEWDYTGKSKHFAVCPMCRKQVKLTGEKIMKHNTNENAVSPVVGSLLMIAICIILAAVVASFVFGMVGNNQKEHNIGFISSLNNGNVILVVNSADPDAMSILDHINVKIDGVDVADWKPTKVSDTITYTGSYSKGTHIQMYGYFYPNNQAQPIYDSTL
jgi:archaeal type IV pilus assembly protein PilA